jgi:SAM-dependent methyltransferase
VHPLLTPDGQAALVAATSVLDEGKLRAAEKLRAAGFDPDLAAAALTQADLRRQAVAKFGSDAARMYFTRAGLEQATRAVVSGRRAARLVSAGATRVADLGCGLGADSIAFARAGLAVMAVERDETTAAFARANAVGLSIAVHCGLAEDADLSDVDTVFCDPARRSDGRRVFDPAAFSPSWSFVVGLADRVARTVLKLAPGLDHALIPDAAEAEWVSVDGDLVEATLWFGFADRVARRATVLRDGAEFTLTGTGTSCAPVSGVDRYVYDPDPAVVRSHLVAEFASTVDGGLADEHLAYVFAGTPHQSPYGRCFEVLEELPFARKQLRAALRGRGIGRLEIRKRGVAIEPDELRRDLRLSGDGAGTLVLLRIGTSPRALLCRPMG